MLKGAVAQIRIAQRGRSEGGRGASTLYARVAGVLRRMAGGRAAGRSRRMLTIAVGE